VRQLGCPEEQELSSSLLFGPDTAADDLIGGLLESMPHSLLIVDRGGRIKLANTNTERYFGYTREELLGEPIEILVPERFRNRHAMEVDHYFAAPHTRATSMGLELFGRRRNGTEFPTEISLGALDTVNGLHVLCVIRDITEQKSAERVASHLGRIVSSSQDAIFSKDLDGVITSWNIGAQHLYGYTPVEVLGNSVAMLMPDGSDGELLDILSRMRSSQQIDDYETVRIRKDGTLIHVWLTVSPIRGQDGNLVGAAVIARDIGTRLHYQEQLEFLADHDSLTGMRNRRRFELDLCDQIRRAHRYREQAALLMIDLDGFKQINDHHGHRAGDEALRTIGAALTSRLRGTDVVARFGGDEFAVLSPHTSPAQAGLLVADLKRVISQQAVKVGDQLEVHLSASIGVIQIDANTPDHETILAEADEMMYLNKRSGEARADRT